MTRFENPSDISEHWYYNAVWSLEVGERVVYLTDGDDAEEPYFHITPIPSWETMTFDCDYPEDFGVELWVVIKNNSTTVLDRAGKKLCRVCVDKVPDKFTGRLPIEYDGEQFVISESSTGLVESQSGGESNGE